MFGKSDQGGNPFLGAGSKLKSSIGPILAGVGNKPKLFGSDA